VDLSETGLVEAHEAGRLCWRSRSRFDIAHTSVLKRAIRTLWIASTSSTRCGARAEQLAASTSGTTGRLQGLNKAEMAVKFGEAQVKLWRRSYDVPPPALTEDDERFPGHDPRYADLADADVPRAEVAQGHRGRGSFPYWDSAIAPDLRAGRRVLVAAHGNSSGPS